MSVGRSDGAAYTTVITGAGTHIAGRWPINLSLNSIGIVTAEVAACVDGATGDGFAVELKAAYRVTGGVLSIGPVAISMALAAFGTASGVTADLDVDGEYVVLLVEGLTGIAFDVDTLWKAWSTA